MGYAGSAVESKTKHLEPGAALTVEGTLVGGPLAESDYPAAQDLRFRCALRRRPANAGAARQWDTHGLRQGGAQGITRARSRDRDIKIAGSDGSGPIVKCDDSEKTAKVKTGPGAGLNGPPDTLKWDPWAPVAKVKFATGPVVGQSGYGALGRRTFCGASAGTWHLRYNGQPRAVEQRKKARIAPRRLQLPAPTRPQNTLFIDAARLSFRVGERPAMWLRRFGVSWRGWAVRPHRRRCRHRQTFHHRHSEPSQQSLPE